MKLEKYTVMDVNNGDVITLKRRDVPRYRILAVPQDLARGLTMDYQVQWRDVDRKTWRYAKSLPILTAADEHIDYLIGYLAGIEERELEDAV